MIFNWESRRRPGAWLGPGAGVGTETLRLCVIVTIIRGNLILSLQKTQLPVPSGPSTFLLGSRTRPAEQYNAATTIVYIISSKKRNCRRHRALLLGSRTRSRMANSLRFNSAEESSEIYTAADSPLQYRALQFV